MKTHGLSTHPLYDTWEHIKSRCLNNNNKDYLDYGGRGITVCNEWKDSFKKFYDDLIISYNKHVEEFGKKETTIDRIDVNGNYELSNVRWATRAEQAINRRNTVTYTNNGITKTVKEWAELYNIEFKLLYARLIIRHWDFKKSTTLIKNYCRLVTYKGVTHNVKDWANILNMDVSTLRSRLDSDNWDLDLIFTTPVKERNK